MPEQDEALRKRVADFAFGVLRFVRALRRDVASDSIIRQIARCAGSVSSNYRDACVAKSVQEFVTKLTLAIAEVDEIDRWFWMAAQLRLGDATRLAALEADAKQLRTMLADTVIEARRHLKHEAAVRRAPR